MGYYIFSCGIKTNEIKSIFGSKNQEMLLKATNIDTFKYYNRESIARKDRTSTQKALEDIINGGKYDDKSGFSYGYALICICKSLGHELPYDQEIKSGYETDFLNQYLKESFQVPNFELEEVLFVDGENSFEIPQIIDWPMIGLLSNSELKELQKKLQHINISEKDIIKLEESEDEDDEEKGIAFEHIQGLILNINYCIEHNLDMVNFCH